MDSHQRDEELNEALLPTTATKSSSAKKTKNHHVVTIMTTESPPTSGQSAGVGGGIISSPRTSSSQNQPRRNSFGKQILGKPLPRPRKAVAQFRKQRRDWNTWTGRIGIHLQVDEFDIDKLASSTAFSTNLHSNGWNYDDLFDVIRLWQVEASVDGHQKELWKGYYPPPIYDNEKADDKHQHRHHKNNTQGQQTHTPPPQAFQHRDHSVGSDGGGSASMSSAVVPEVYIFSFGAVVFWNFPNSESELQWMNDNLLTSTLSDCYGDRFANDEIESATDDMGFKFATHSIIPSTPTDAVQPSHAGESADVDAPSLAVEFSLQRDVATLTTLEYGQRLAISFALLSFRLDIVNKSTFSCKSLLLGRVHCSRL